MRYLLPFLYLGFTVLAAQTTVHRYGENHELRTGYITDILSGSDGFLWVASQAGLRRFDGEEIRGFSHIRTDSTSLTGSLICLLEDADGALWVGQHNGLSRYDPQTERFRNFPTPDSGPVHAMHESSQGTLWISTDEGVRQFDRERMCFAPDTLIATRQQHLGFGPVTDFLELPSGEVLLASDEGLLKVGPSTDNTTVVYHDRAQAIRPLKIAETDSGDIIVGGRKGIFRLTAAADSFRIAEHLPLQEAPDLPGTICNDLLRTGPNTYWAATNAGLFQLSWESGGGGARVQGITHDADDQHTPSSNLINCLDVSADGVLWVGTRFGVNRSFIGPTPFTAYQRRPGKVELCSNYTKGTAFDPDYDLLVIATTLGVSVLDLQTNLAVCYNPENLPGLRSASIINVDPGPSPHTFWILYRRGGADLLDLTEPQGPKIIPVAHPPGATDVTHAYQVAYRANGTCLIATGRGLFSYDPVTGGKEWLSHDPTDDTSLPDNYCYAVLVDREDHVWVGTRNAGLCRMWNKDGKIGFDHWGKEEGNDRSLPGNLVLDIFQDTEERLWVSTPGGISLWEGEGRFRTFTEQDGLPHPLSYGIFEDRGGNLWTVQGGQITRFALDPEGVFQVGDGFRQRDGMADDFMGQYGWSVLDDGRIAISHPDGLTLFHPDSLEKDNYLPPVLLTEIQLFNQPVAIEGSPADTNGSKFLLPSAPNTLAALDLPPGQNFLSISFAAPEFRPYHEVRYAYRMAGIQDEWTTTEQRTYLSFPKLPPGDYLLELRSGDKRERWSNEIRTLNIHLAAPWYQRWWALVGFGLAGTGLVAFLSTERERQRRRIEAARLAEREEFRRRSARDFHDEAGNHLSRVSLLTTVARRELETPAAHDLAGTRVQSFLTDIDDNVQVLREGMRDFIWALDPGNDNAYDLGLRLRRFGQELFEHHPAEFVSSTLDPTLEKFELRADERRQLLLIAKEAMHNSFKHAQRVTRVVLELERMQKGTLRLSWNDNGQGFCIPTEGDGQGLKNMRGRAAKVGAEIKIHARQGCTVEVMLVTDQSV